MEGERKDGMDQRRTITTGTGGTDDSNPLEDMYPLDIISGMSDDRWMADNERYLTPDILGALAPIRRWMDEQEGA